MIDTRAVGQEVQDQFLAAARKGRQRVTSTVKTVTATAHMVRPQLPAVHIGLPTPAQLREKAPAIIAKLPHPDQLREKAPAIIAKLPHPDQLRERAAKIGKLPTARELRASAEEFTGQVLAAQRQMISQVRSATTPLAKQAAAVFAQAGQAAKGQAAPLAGQNGEAREAEHVTPAEPHAHAEAAKPAEHGEHAKHAGPAGHEPAGKTEAAATKPAHTAARRGAASARKSKTRPATK